MTSGASCRPAAAWRSVARKAGPEHSQSGASTLQSGAPTQQQHNTKPDTEAGPVPPPEWPKKSTFSSRIKTAVEPHKLYGTIPLPRLLLWRTASTLAARETAAVLRRPRFASVEAPQHSPAGLLKGLRSLRRSGGCVSGRPSQSASAAAALATCGPACVGSVWKACVGRVWKTCVGSVWKACVRARAFACVFAVCGAAKDVQPHLVWHR
eukprot:349966-Chlamydomonas_euryale.AAC.1